MHESAGERPPEGARGEPSRRVFLGTVLRAPFTARAWAEAAYCLIGFPLAVVGTVLVLVLLALGTGLTASSSAPSSGLRSSSRRSASRAAAPPCIVEARPGVAGRAGGGASAAATEG